MSKSRLEKFLYALYSLDSSDLPTPLSRIEELYKCWVTGEEAPAFEPLSRVEKYLIAILGVYDVNELPNPLSRVEVLLYKLATGDDNLDDVKSFLSEHEELLAEIIRNGGAGGNIDIEYVLYNLSTEFNTLYNTAEKPVERAILTGNTLVNLLNKLTVNGEVEQTTSWYTTTYTTGTLKSGTYILLYHVKETSGTTTRNTPGIGLASGTYLYHGYDDFNTTTGIKKWIFTTDEDSSEFGYWLTYNTGKVVVEDFILLEYQEGMENWDIPYFEGMQSVQMPVLTTTGKNLMDINSRDVNSINYHGVTYSIDANGYYSIKGTFTSRGRWVNTFDLTISDTWGNSGIITEDFMLKKGTYTLSVCDISGETSTPFSFIRLYKKPFASIAELYNQTSKTFTLNEDTKFSMMFQTITCDSGDSIDVKFKVQIEEGTQATPYEPYKSNILTVNEEVELLGIGNVRDELDLLTGEVTQRVGEVVLDGSEKWLYEPTYTNDNVYGCYIGFEQLTQKPKPDNFNFANNMFPNITNNSYSQEGFATNPAVLSLRINKNKLDSNDVSGFKKYLQNHPVTLQYPLVTESIKTVDLSVVDQDGNSTKLKTFDDITYVALSSEGLIPEAELEVATKNEEVISTLSLEMDDISTAQTTLEETSNAQSENVDATMIATTEIYEELL